MTTCRRPTTAALLCAALLSVTAGARADAPAIDADLDHWVAGVAERNDIAHDVAAYKFPRGRPIEDPQREAVVLDDKHARAARLGLDADAVVAAYRQLIEANKLLQHVDVQAFALGAPVPPVPSLEDVRQRIDRVDHRLLARWAALDAVRAAPDCEGRVAQAIHRRVGGGAECAGRGPGAGAGRLLPLGNAV